MGNQNQNQNQNPNNDPNSDVPPNPENTISNNSPAPNNINNNSENQNIINEQNNNLNNNSSENENPNKINEETNNGEENKAKETHVNQENEENNSAPPNSENINSDCPVPADISSYEKNFSFSGLMSKIKETAKKAGLRAIYMALLLYYALESPTISVMDKAIIYGALGYFIAPIDIVPDILPLVGLSDDIAVLAWAFSRVKHNVTDLTREKAKTKLKIWFGDFDEREIDNL